MSSEESRALVMALHDIWNSGQVEKIADVYSTTCTVHWAKGWGPESTGHPQIKQAIIHTRTIFPDWHEEVLDTIVTPGKVVTRYRSSGTQQGEYLGIAPTGRTIAFEELSIYRIEQSRIAEQWCLGDDLHCIAQLKSAGS